MVLPPSSPESAPAALAESQKAKAGTENEEPSTVGQNQV